MRFPRNKYRVVLRAAVSLAVKLHELAVGILHCLVFRKILIQAEILEIKRKTRH